MDFALVGEADLYRVDHAGIARLPKAFLDTARRALTEHGTDRRAGHPGIASAV